MEAVTYVVGLTKSFMSYTLHVVSLDSSTGIALASVDVPSSINGPLDLVTLTSSRTPQPILAWLEDSHIRSVALTPNLAVKLHTIREDIYKELKDVGIADAGIFLALKRDDTCHVLRVDLGTQSVKKVWEFANSVRQFICIIPKIYLNWMRRLRRPTSPSSSTQVALTRPASRMSHARFGPTSCE